MPAADTFGRRLGDLRISVTDRCNFRCVYCMPREVFGPNYEFVPRSALLSFEEITRIATAFVDAGAEKIRLTGGEPLLRRNLETLVEGLARLTVRDLALTTNGSLLTRAKARSLRSAGLRRVTVSLDSLDDETFRRMNDTDCTVERVLEAIDAAADAGLAPVKVDVVVRRHLNDSEIAAIAGFFRGTGHIVRFIEYMDVGTVNGWRLEDVVPAAVVLATVRAQWPAEPVGAAYPGEVAERWRYLDGRGEFGLITSVTRPFCGSCTRARLSASGEFFTCLFGATGVDLRRLIRSGADDEQLRAAIASIWSARSDRYSEIRSEATAALPRVEMSHIGG